LVKSVACRIRSSGRELPQDMVDLLGRDRFNTMLAISFCVNEHILPLPPETRAGFIGMGDLMVYQPCKASSFEPRYVWEEHVSWFTVRYWYNHPSAGPCGSLWVANAQYVY